ncbi:hypothetical protein F5X97DRAFT_297022 [Nemania serpens]|nr:hypothetical protein F5X97DRAFT_297022 [Nemania serpens]
MKWDPQRVQAFLYAKYPKDVRSDLLVDFQHIDALADMLTAVDLTSGLGLPVSSTELLFSLATPAAPPVAKSNFNDAKGLRLVLHSHALASGPRFNVGHDRLRENQRRALVEYLLQNDVEYGRGLNFSDSNDIYAHCLIDVKMGPVLQTSRLKQAISSVQTFVQRCMLGLENSGFGVPAGIINRDNWEYMMRYRFWEANRKAFLYAESWLDPTLRDDKTEQFKTLESTVVQKKLTFDSLSEAIKQYINDVNHVSNLDVQAYTVSIEGLPRITWQMHLFARTRAAPWQYYHRVVEIIIYEKHYGDWEVLNITWSPWERMTADIQTHELPDKAFHKGSNYGCYMLPAVCNKRVFLILPQLTATTIKVNKSESGKKPTEDKRWAIRMSWTEYRNGKWTTQKLSDAVLYVDGLEDDEDLNTTSNKDSDIRDNMEKRAKRFPGIETFKFWLTCRKATIPAANGIPEHITEVLVVDVKRWLGPADRDNYIIDDPDGYGGDSLRYKGFYALVVGQFEWKMDRFFVTRSKPEELPDKLENWARTIPTNFTKLKWDVPSNLQGWPKTSHQWSDHVYAIPDKFISPATHTFTMAFGWGRLSLGCVLDIGTNDSSSTILRHPIPYSSMAISDHISPLLFTAAYDGGISDNDVDPIYAALSTLPKKTWSEAFGVNPKTEIPHELASAGALYTWEVGMHMVSLLAERLLSVQQYDLALRVTRWAFNPMNSGPDGDPYGRCWGFIPFRNKKVRDYNPLSNPSAWADSGSRLDIQQWNTRCSNVHAAARGRPSAYMKRLVFKYIEILIASGDDLFRQNTLETIPLAIQRYSEASHVFGPPPEDPAMGGKGGPGNVKRKSLSYNQLAASLDSSSNAKVQLELDFPFRAAPVKESNGTWTEKVPFIQTYYFCIPANPEIAALRSLLDDRLYKCRHGLDITGRPQKLALFEPPIDPGLLMGGGVDGQLNPFASIASDVAGVPMPNYRFEYILARAFDLCRELKEMSERALAVREKRDNEALSTIVARHSTIVNNLVLQMKTRQRAEALAEIEVLRETRRAQVSSLKFYLSLTGDAEHLDNMDSDEASWKDLSQAIGKPTMDDVRTTQNEHQALQKMDDSINKLNIAWVPQAAAAVLDFVPVITINADPLGTGFSYEFPTSSIARALHSGAAVMSLLAQMDSEEGTRVARKGQLLLQLQERRQLANQAGREIQTINRRVAAAKERLAVCDKDILAQRQMVDNAAEMEAWLQSKYTSVELYAWMENKYSMLTQRTYSLARDLAMKAERAFAFERPAQDRVMSSNLRQGWDGGGDGRNDAFFAQNLWLDLKRIEMAFMERRSHDFEVSTVVSLRQIDPWQLLVLRETGKATFSLPESLFDMDFPGHYCRRIASVSVTIPCIVGPYTSLNCTLRLQQHKYRVTNSLNGGYNPDASHQDTSTTPYRADSVPITSVAIGKFGSSEQPSGTFELNFDGGSSRYTPFEGAGTISTWQLELPPTLRQFDYSTISDVVLRLRYTALDGGAALKQAANESAFASLRTAPTLSAAMIEVPFDFATGWYPFKASLGAGSATATLPMPGVKGLLPFWTKRARSFRVDTVTIAFYPASSSLSEVAGAMTLTGCGTPVSDFSTKNILEDYLVVDHKFTEARMKRDWKIDVNNPKGLKVAVEKMWIMIRYAVLF